MHCDFYEGRSEELVQWCCAEENLQQYESYLSTEMEQLADISLLQHLRQLQRVIQELRTHGFVNMAEEQRGALDALFSDMLACATWQEWPVPLSFIDQRSLPLDIEQRGLLGADEALNAAMVFIIDDRHIGIARQREADTQARHPHDSSFTE